MASGTTGRAPFFDFVSLMHPKSMLKMSNQESLVPIAVMCVIFFLWGFAYGFIHVLNVKFQQAAGYELQKSSELHAAYFGAYVFGPILVARPILYRWGFKATLIAGLSIYSCGTLVFWPAAILISLPAFVIANFIVGLGLSVVETAADLFIALCGPMDHAEMRLNFAQGVQAVGGIISPILAHQVLFKDVNDAPALISVQWTYLGITIVTIFVAVAYNFLQLPEASKDELKQLADRRREDYRGAVCGIRVVWVTLTLGVMSQFCNIGGQEDHQTKFRSFMTDSEPR
jgi:fucose permease